MLNVDIWRFLASAGFFLALLLTATFFDLGRAPNLQAHDFFVDSGVVSAVPENIPLLVSVETEDVNRTTLMQVVQNLYALGAEDLVIMPELSERLLSSQMLPALDSTVFSESLWLTAANTSAQRDRYAPLQLLDSIRTATLPPPTFANGYYRYLTPPPVNSSHPFAPGESAMKNGDSWGINFLFLSNGQPEVSAKQVASGQLIPDLVEGTSVLIEMSSAGADPGYAVPGKSEAIDSLHIQGLILSTLVNDSAVEPYPVWMALLLVVMLFILNLIILQWLSPLQSTSLSAIAVFILIVAFALALQYGFRIFPLAELVTTQLASLVFVFQAQRLNEDRAVASMLAETNSMLSERFAPTSFFQSNNPWAKIVVLINQQLQLNRSILLEKLPRDHRVREIQALNCNIDSIAEQRRDYQRTPYSTAIEFGGAYRLEGQFFKETSADEIEYLVPLQFANEVMGFWALTVSPVSNWNQLAFESNVSDFAAQIAELLFHRDQWQKERKLQGRMGPRLAALEGGRSRHRELQNALQLLEKRLDEMEGVFTGLGSAALLYDLFGQIKQANQRLELLARDSGFSPYSLTAAELLCEVCDLNLDEARRELRHVTLKQEPVFLPVKPINQQHSYMLHVRPIRRTLSASGDRRIRGEIDPFQLVGILFEFVDVSHTHELLAARDDVLAQFSSDIRTPLNRITLAANRLKRLNPSDEAAAKVDAIDSAITQAVQMIDGMSQINVSANDDPYRRRSLVPINPLRLVKHSLASVAELAREKRLTVVEDWPFRVPLALANNELLRQLLKNLLTLLINDASPDSCVTVAIGNEEQSAQREVVISLSNQGYGLPKSTLQNLLERSPVLLLGSDDLLEHTIGSLQSLAYWGASFEADSQVGQGFQFSIRLRGVGLDETKSE